MGRVSWRRSFQIPGNPLPGGSVGSFGISEGNITGRGEKKEKKPPEIRCLAATPSREVAQKLKSASSKQRLNREVRAAFLEWGPGLNALRTI